MTQDRYLGCGTRFVFLSRTLMEKTYHLLPKIWFALALVLTTATQLRWNNLPMGPGELMLVIWLMSVGFHILKQGRFPLSVSFKLLIIFWGLGLVSLCAGWLVGLSQGVFDAAPALHNLLAYLFVSFVALFGAIHWRNDEIKQIGEMVLIFSIGGLIPLLIYAQYSNKLYMLSLWLGKESRFLGWSRDPNQIAILVGPFPFLALYYLKKHSSALGKVLFLLLFTCSIVLGLSTDSDSLKVAWMVSVVIYSILVLLLCGKVTYRKAAVVSGIVLLCYFAGVFIFGSEVVSWIENIYYKQDQGSVRLALWVNGLQAASHSPLVGLGPGAFSGVQEAFAGMECHNTFIDWMTNTGVIGLLLLIFLLSWTFIKALSRSNDPEAVAVLTTVITVSLFLYVIRHPIWWLYIIWVISAMSSRKECHVHIQ